MSEVVKMKQGMSYTCKEKTIILNVYKYFRSNYPEICVTEIVRRTAKATGCSEKSIFQFRKEEASPEGFKEPSKSKTRKNVNINSRDVKYGHQIRQSIRQVIYDLKQKNVIPSLNTILKKINSDSDLPNFSLMTLRRLMFDMGFYYEKNGNKAILTEKSESSLKKEENRVISYNKRKSKHLNRNDNNNCSNENVFKNEVNNLLPLQVNSSYLNHQNSTTDPYNSLNNVDMHLNEFIPNDMPMIISHHLTIPQDFNENYVRNGVLTWINTRIN